MTWWPYLERNREGKQQAQIRRKLRQGQPCQSRSAWQPGLAALASTSAGSLEAA